MRATLSLRDIEHTAQLIAERHPQKGANPKLIYGVPRGGIPAAYAVAACYAHARLVEDPAEADLIVDDLIDSGATAQRFKEQYPDIPFDALYTKPDEWLVFPWEESAEGAASDIPIRLLQYIGEDTDRGGLKETPARYLKAWKHFTSGYGQDPAEILKVFEDGAEGCDQMVLVKNIPVYSQCEHHLVPFFGVAHVAYIPNGKIVGLSKISRIVNLFARRLQVQERLTNQIAKALNDNLAPLGVAVMIECRHMCMESRGISQQGSSTISEAMLGVFLDNAATRSEFMSLISTNNKI